jgi:sarcosine oxidase
LTEIECVVVGLGGAGSAAAYHVARSGGRVLGLEQFGPVHGHGSSHGRTRIYRTAYMEGARYVPLCLRAQELWRQLELDSGESVLRPTGGLVIGRRTNSFASESLRTAIECRLPHEVLDPWQVERRFPQFVLAPDEMAVFDPNAGALFPETCVRAHASGAVEAGAELRYGTRVKEWSADASGVTVRTESAELRARTLVLTVGAWTSRFDGGLALPLEIERQFMLWFRARNAALVGPHRMPVFVWDRGEEARTYGVPDFGDGVKVGAWNGKVAASPEEADREYRESDGAPIRAFVEQRLRGVEPREIAHVACLYTNTPDRDFVIGVHPRHPNVIVVSACSGHGFKFTSVIGEIVARLARHEAPGFDLTPFAPDRFQR